VTFQDHDPARFHHHDPRGPEADSFQSSVSKNPDPRTIAVPVEAVEIVERFPRLCGRPSWGRP
jgi:hypothetical protein